jgi:outer membrane immunogenic protein
MRGFLLGSVVLAALAGPTMAADRAIKAPPPPPPVPVYSWTGCYAGGNAGGIIGADKYDLSMGGDFLLPGNIFANPANRAQLDHSYNSNQSGFTGGAQIGCNYQTGVWVWGVEADINSAAKLSTTNNFGPAGPFAPPTLPTNLASSHTEIVTKELNWYSTFRGRIGFTPVSTWLVYVTGGVAVAAIGSTTNVAFGANQFFLNNVVLSGSQTQTRPGWTLGGGMEWAFASNWSLKAEYLYLDFGSFSYSSLCFSGACGVGTNFLWNTTVRAQEHIVRAGLNYRFGGDSTYGAY